MTQTKGPEMVPDPTTRGFILSSLSDGKPRTTKLTSNMWLEFVSVLGVCQSFERLLADNPIQRNVIHRL